MHKLSYFTIDIELRKAYLKKYLEYHLDGLDSLTVANPFGAAIVNMLKQAPVFVKPKKSDPSRTITVKVYRFRFMGASIPKEHSRAFNAFVEQTMKKEFINSCELVVTYAPHIEIKQVIQDFMAKYDLEDEDLAPNSIRRWWLRSKEYRELSENQ